MTIANTSGCSTSRRADRARAGLRGAAILAALACSLASTACGDDGDRTALGVLEAQSGPFDGDIVLDSDSPAVGEHGAELVLVDGTGNPLRGAAVEIVPFMPAHGHGSPKVEATETAPGHYLTEKMSLFMPGVWELRVHVVEGEAEGRLVATFEVR